MASLPAARNDPRRTLDRRDDALCRAGAARFPCRRIPPRRPRAIDAPRCALPRCRALGAKARPEQGLIISKRLYEKIGGHSESAADPEADLIDRIGRRRIVRLATRASWVGRDT